MNPIAQISTQGTLQAGSDQNVFNTQANASGKTAFVSFVQDLQKSTFAPGQSVPTSVISQNFDVVQEAEVPQAEGKQAPKSGTSITETREFSQNIMRTVTLSDGTKEVFTANTEAFLKATGDQNTAPSTSFDLTQTPPDQPAIAAKPETPTAKPEIKAEAPTAKPAPAPYAAPTAKPEVKAEAPTAKPAPAPYAAPTAKPEVKAEAPTAKPAPAPYAAPTAKPEVKAEAPTAKPEVKAEAPTAKPEVKAEAPAPYAAPMAKPAPAPYAAPMAKPAPAPYAAPMAKPEVPAESHIIAGPPKIMEQLRFAPSITLVEPKAQPAPAPYTAPMGTAATETSNRAFSFSYGSSSTSSSSSSESFSIGRNFTSIEKTTDQRSFGSQSSTSFTKITKISRH